VNEINPDRTAIPAFHPLFEMLIVVIRLSNEYSVDLCRITAKLEAMSGELETYMATAAAIRLGSAMPAATWDGHDRKDANYHEQFASESGPSLARTGNVQDPSTMAAHPATETWADAARINPPPYLGDENALSGADQTSLSERMGASRRRGPAATPR
jgi:hypothetical protein